MNKAIEGRGPHANPCASCGYFHVSPVYFHLTSCYVWSLVPCPAGKHPQAQNSSQRFISSKFIPIFFIAFLKMLLFAVWTSQTRPPSLTKEPLQLDLWLNKRHLNLCDQVQKYSQRFRISCSQAVFIELSSGSRGSAARTGCSHA